MNDQNVPARMSSQLDDITQKREELVRQQRAHELGAIIEDPAAPAEAKAYATKLLEEMSSGQPSWWAVLSSREKAAVQMAASYAALGQPGLPDHLYLTMIHKLAQLLDELAPAFELTFEDEDEGGI